MNYEELETAFRTWWAQSFPSAPANIRTVETHAAFAAYVLDMVKTLEEYTNDPL
jgi:hypothetical protein